MSIYKSLINQNSLNKIQRIHINLSINKTNLQQNTSFQTQQIMSSNSILHHEFHTLSQENTRLNQNLISITLNHQTLIEQSRQLTEQLKKKDYAVIESTLRQKNLQHTLKNVKNEYAKLQDQYQQLYDWMRSQKKLQMRDVYKKESQLAMDMAFIERQSYRECKKSKNEQLNLYQQRIIGLSKQNQTLKSDILQLTSEYNTKIYELKAKSLQNELKLKKFENISTSLKKKQSISLPIFSSQSGLPFVQLQLKLQNTKQKLQFYMKQNSQIKKRNNELNNQNIRLFKQLKMSMSKAPVEKKQSELWRILQKQNCSIEFITSIFDENSRLRKQIEQITKKYVLLGQTYPKLIDEFETISELQENIERFNRLKQIQHQLQESRINVSYLQQSLSRLQLKYLNEIKTRQVLQYKSSILTKRFNQIFIRMNPYFDIYQYELLQMDESLYNFFDENKDYKNLKQYENKISQMRRQLKQSELRYEVKQRELRMKLDQKQRQVIRNNKDRQQRDNKLNEMTDCNMILKQKLKSYQLLYGDQKLQKEQNSDKINIKKIQNEITIPLLQSLVNKLQLQREQLLNIIYRKDSRILQVQGQLLQSVKGIRIQPIILTSEQLPVGYRLQSGQISVQFIQLLEQNKQLQKKYDDNVMRLSQQINRMQQKLNNQHNLYQLQVKKYQNEYQLKIIQLKKLINQWSTISQQLRVKLIFQQQQKLAQKQKQNKKILLLQQQQNNNNVNNINNMNNNNQVNQQNKQIRNNNQFMIQQNNQQPINNININNNQPNQSNQILIPSQISHSNLQHIPAILNHQQSVNNNKLIGQSTVQTLTSTLKKYQHDMNQVLIMCSKISEQYSSLKNKIQSQQLLQQQNNHLKSQLISKQSTINQLKHTLQQNNQSLSNLQNLYQAKYKQCQHAKQSIQKQTLLLQSQIKQEHIKYQILNKQLLTIKQQFYQLASKPNTINQLDQPQSSLINKGQFQTIVVMHANKNKEISQLADKNISLENKVQSLMQQLNIFKLKNIEKNKQQISPLQRAQIRQLSQLLQQTNVIELVQKANNIIEKQAQKQKLLKEQQQKQRKQQQQRLLAEQQEIQRLLEQQQRQQQEQQHKQIENKMQMQLQQGEQ